MWSFHYCVHTHTLKSQQECHTEFSLEECRSRFLFGITTVIRQLTSSPLAEGDAHTAALSATMTTLFPAAHRFLCSANTSGSSLHLNQSKFPLQPQSTATDIHCKVSLFFLPSVYLSFYCILVFKSETQQTVKSAVIWLVSLK